VIGFVVLCGWLVGRICIFVSFRVDGSGRKKVTYSISLSTTLLSSSFEGLHPETRKKR
jgi:hypothetical protein